MKDISDNSSKRLKSQVGDVPVVVGLLGIVVLLILGSIVIPDMMSKGIASGTNFLADTFGWLYLAVYAMNFVLVFIIGFSRYGSIRLGGLEKPEFSTFSWMSMIFAAALAVSLIFFAPADLIMNSATVPPAFPGVEPGSNAAIEAAIAYMGVNWMPMFPGYCLAAVGLMIAHYHRGLPMNSSSMLYPVLWKRTGGNPTGGVIGRGFNFFASLAILAGMLAPIGLLALSLGRSLQVVYDIVPNNLIHTGIIIGTTVIVILGAVTGLHKGIRLLANWNSWLLLVLGLAILALGPTLPLIKLIFSSFGIMISEYPRLALWTNPFGDITWLSYWPIFFAAFCIGWIPLMGIFFARISRGRTIREITVFATLILNGAFFVWYLIMAGSSVHYDRLFDGIATKALAEGGTEMVLWAWLSQIPGHQILVPLFMIVTVIVLASSADAIADSLAVTTTGLTDPSKWHKILWSVAMGGTSLVLLYLGGLTQIQGAILITAFPVAIAMVVYNLKCLPKMLKDVEKSHYLDLPNEHLNISIPDEDPSITTTKEIVS
ncbi:BCCT family transporter [Neobacillus niacini]|uniref:BCCT family transporter n=1 Tax=Neobacillus niacini TaxID=86668 RepID=UPI003002739C